MLTKSLIVATLLVVSTFAKADGFENLQTQNISIPANGSEAKLDRLVGSLDSVFKKFTIALDSGSTIVRNATVGGSAGNPTYNVGVKKCVFIKCMSVNLDLFAKAEKISGTCQSNYQVEVDLGRSSPLITNYFKQMLIDVCAQPSADKMNVRLAFRVQKAQNPPTGFTASVEQQQVLGMLQIQPPALAKAVLAALNAQ